MAGVLPTDLEIDRWAAIQKEASRQEATEHMLNQWPDRWNQTMKGRRTYKCINDVRERMVLPLRTDQYVCQIVGHGDYNGKLR